MTVLSVVQVIFHPQDSSVAPPAPRDGPGGGKGPETNSCERLAWPWLPSAFRNLSFSLLPSCPVRRLLELHLNEGHSVRGLLVATKCPLHSPQSGQVFRVALLNGCQPSLLHLRSWKGWPRRLREQSRHEVYRSLQITLGIKPEQAAALRLLVRGAPKLWAHAFHPVIGQTSSSKQPPLPVKGAGAGWA